MAMVNVVYWLPTGGLMAERSAATYHCFCVDCMNQVNSRSVLSMMTEP